MKPTRVGWVAALLLLFGHAPRVAAEEEPSRYVGTIAVDYTPSSYNPNFPDNPDQAATKALVKASCGANSCTITETPRSQGDAFWGEAVFPLTVPIGGSISVPRVASDEPDDCDSGGAVPDGTLSLTKDGEALTIVAEFAEYKLSGGDCVEWDQSVVTTFVGELTAAADTEERTTAGADSGSAGSAGSGRADEERTDSNEGIGIPVLALVAVPIAGGAFAAVAVRRRKRSTGAGPAAAGPRPQVRPVADPGVQALTMEGPAMVVRVTPTPDPNPRITVTVAPSGDGSFDERGGRDG